MKNKIIAVGTALMFLLSSVAYASDFQTRFGSDFEPDAQGWGKVEYKRYSFPPSGDLEISVPSLTTSAGFDIPLAKTVNGQWFGGFSVSNVRERGEYRNTANHMYENTAWSKVYIGNLSATYIGNQGFYFDGGVQFGSHEYDVATCATIKGTSAGINLEAGQKIPFGETWAVTPSAAYRSIVYSGDDVDVGTVGTASANTVAKTPCDNRGNVNLFLTDAFKGNQFDTNGNKIGFDDGAIEDYRLGLLLEKGIERGRVYGEVNFGKTQFPDNKSPLLDSSWDASYGVGTDLSFGKSTTLSLNLFASDVLDYGAGATVKVEF